MERATKRPAGRPAADLELLVHGVGGTTPERMLGDPRTVRVTGDGTAAVFRRAGDAQAGRRPGREPVREAYVWCNLTSGDGSRALWLLLLPFMVVNLAHWMRPAAPGRQRTVRLYGLLVRLAALTLTVLLVAAACEVALDLVAWQCAGVPACARRHSWLGFLAPGPSAGGWWSTPGRRLALAALLPAALTGLLWYLSHRTWNAYESHRPTPHYPAPDTDDSARGRFPASSSSGPDAGCGVQGPAPASSSGPDTGGGEPGPALASRASGPDTGGGAPGPSPAFPAPEPHTAGTAPDSSPASPAPGPGTGGSALAQPGFWYGRRLVARLRGAHTAAGLLTVASAVAVPAVRFDHRPGGPAALDGLSWLLTAALAAWAGAVAWVVCCRGRSENRLDRRLDRQLVRCLPLGALALLLLTLLYAGWSRPGWRSAGRLPGDPAFGALTLAQGLLVLALAVVAADLHRRRPDPRTVMRGLGGPAVALLACALGGVISGGVAQRVADWLDGTRALLPGPPVLLTWQASAIPALLAVLLLLAVRLGAGTVRLARGERDLVRREHPGEPEEPARTRAIAHTRAMATLTDRAPLVLAVLTGSTLLLGAGALAGALATGKTPDGASQRAPDAVQAMAETSQALGSWLVGLGFLLFVTWGRRAYKDAAARRTIGILWDVGTFWPRAAHPFAPPCYAERAVPDLTWRMATWTLRTEGRVVLSGHSQGSVLAAAAAWQLTPAVRARVALLTYGSPLERLYGRWFPAHFGPPALAALHRDVACWRNLHRRTDPIGGPVRVPGDGTPDVDCEPLKDPLAYGRTPDHPLPAPILGHSDYQADPAFTRERSRLLNRLGPALPGQRPEPDVPHRSGRPLDRP
ncbi:hypothetical protein GCM10010503_19110 [Streptomyces lucensis JCM 4490]|uniref:Integral membrane protein n=1 Tax=Streptomyces lucensis JCM 4490 TaxID=1306176 RepID=A0A918J1S5_9ACTN|nr:hypothetical protein GCM10010503_19110 [Streptomyces lucensis JCM 4490]